MAISFEEMKNREKNVDKKEPKMTLSQPFPALGGVGVPAAVGIRFTRLLKPLADADHLNGALFGDLLVLKF